VGARNRGLFINRQRNAYLRNIPPPSHCEERTTFAACSLKGLGAPILSFCSIERAAFQITFIYA